MTDTGKEAIYLISSSRQEVSEDYIASLQYAGMIQNALMPDKAILSGLFKDYFVLFLPKDIVSGDFYYSYANTDYICIAAGDCTGHGVPGALMSILGISFLNEILQCRSNIKANRVLNLMREKVMIALHQTGTCSETKDSIDIALCLLEIKTGVMQFSGAGRPLIMIRDKELFEYKPDKMTIGIDMFNEKAFKNNLISTKPGDSFYLFSDGYSDQFGEKTKKKFKHIHFKEILESFAGMPMIKQKEELENSFNDWKGNCQQIDDILVFGFKI
jgi:serine phosphatase RsbU (regulator of sigma subunit)